MCILAKWSIVDAEVSNFAVDLTSDVVWIKLSVVEFGSLIIVIGVVVILANDRTDDVSIDVVVEYP